MNWAQMSKQNLNLWLKSRNKEILSTKLLNRISHLALERVYISMNTNSIILSSVKFKSVRPLYSISFII